MPSASELRLWCYWRMVSITDYGAVGDGKHDDTAAIQAALDSGARTIFFPVPEVTYRITKSLKLGEWSWGGPGTDPGGVANAKPCVRLLGESGRPTQSESLTWTKWTLTWDGPDQPGSTKDIIQDSTGGRFPLITDAKPMLAIMGSYGLIMENMSFNGKMDANAAFACVHNEGPLCTQYNIRNCFFTNATIGWRNGTIWDWVGVANGPYLGLAGSPSFLTNKLKTRADHWGGWQGDTHLYENCYFEGTTFGYASESGENLFTTFVNCQFTGGKAGIGCAGGHIAMIGGGFYGNQSLADFLHISGTTRFTASHGVHSESTAPWNVRIGTGEIPIHIENSDIGKIYYNANTGGYLKLANIDGVKIERHNSTSSKLYAVIENCGIQQLDVSNTAGKEFVNIEMTNCTLAYPILTGPTATNGYIKALNCYPPANLPQYVASYRSPCERVEGNRHYIAHSKMVQANTVTPLGSVQAHGPAVTGSCTVTLTFAGPSSGPTFGVAGTYTFSWVRGASHPMTVSAVAVLSETKALDGVADVAPTVTVTANGGAIDINVAQTNTLNSDARVEVYGEVYLGSYDATVPLEALVWHPV